jgi:NADPH:quinone reductase-like Zn-dependent oxidoreductase
VVLDLVGNHALAALRRTVAPDGILVLAGGGTSTGGSLVGPMGLVIRGMLAARFTRGRIAVLGETPSAENLVTLREMIESGRVTPVVDRTYPLSAAAEAIQYVESEHARAKVVLTVL